MPSRLEQEIQTNVTNEARKLQLIPIRLNVTGRKGWPDYGYMHQGRICFVEFKRPGEKPEPLQLHVHDMLRLAQFDVFVVDNEDYGNTLLKEWKRHVDKELERICDGHGDNA
jgi:hypothetical protein